MKSLEDLVTSNLAPTEAEKEIEQFSPLPPLEILSSGKITSSANIQKMCREIPLQIKSNPDQAPYLLAQLLAYLSRMVLPGSQKSRALWVLALAATYARNRDQEAYQDICDWTQNIEEDLREKDYRQMEKIALASTTSRLDFLAEFFEENLAEELVYITGVQPATARRWIQGAGISWSNNQRINLVARIFYALRHKQGFSTKDTLLFYTNNWQDSSSSPREMVANYNYVAGGNMQSMLRSIGVRE